jgi:hypothetical protein
MAYSSVVKKYPAKKISSAVRPYRKKAAYTAARRKTGKSTMYKKPTGGVVSRDKKLMEELRKMVRDRTHRILMRCKPDALWLPANTGNVNVPMYFRVPVTALIPGLRPQGAPASPLWTRGPKVKCSYAKITMVLKHALPVRIRAVCHTVDSLRSNELVDRDVKNGMPIAWFLGENPMKGQPRRMMTLDETGLSTSSEGPYKVVNDPLMGGSQLDSPDGQVYDCPLNLKGLNPPLGEMRWRKSNAMKESTGKAFDVTLDASVSHQNTQKLDVKRGFLLHDTKAVSFFVRIDKEIEMTGEGVAVPVDGRHIEVLVAIKSTAIIGIGEGGEFPIGDVRGVTSEVYYSSY